jgi:hypothetical protein
LQAILWIRFDLPTEEGEDRSWEASCMVIRTARAACIDERLPVLVGLHFLSITGENFDFLRRWVWSQLD